MTRKTNGGTPVTGASRSRWTTSTPSIGVHDLSTASQDEVRGAPGGGEIEVRPWGERSLYVVDQWQNPLCFVEAGTIHSG